jgi:peptide deformylase
MQEQRRQMCRQPHAMGDKPCALEQRHPRQRQPWQQRCYLQESSQEQCRFDTGIHHLRKDFRLKVFLNAQITEESGDKWAFNEGCLSIPDIREDVSRHQQLHIRYQDENWNWHEERYHGLAARVIQHEYDHIDGKLLTDRLSPLRKAMLKNRLEAISKGMVKVDYKMKFPNLKKGR